jgi:hypothetical protein
MLVYEICNLTLLYYKDLQFKQLKENKYRINKSEEYIQLGLEINPNNQSESLNKKNKIGISVRSGNILSNIVCYNKTADCISVIGCSLINLS